MLCVLIGSVSFKMNDNVIAQEPTSADICTLLLSFVRGCQGGPDPSPPAKYKFLKITF